MTTNAVAVSQDFQERLFEKIRKDIGELMTDKEVKALVDRTIERVFFTPEVKRDTWGHEREIKPPKIEQLLSELMEPTLRKAMKDWLDEHPDEVKAALDKALSGGLATATLRALDGMLSAQFSSLQFNLQQSLQQALQR